MTRSTATESGESRNWRGDVRVEGKEKGVQTDLIYDALWGLLENSI